MKNNAARLLQVIGVALLAVGILFALDGLLPMRSQGSNPSWAEVAIGVTIMTLGWLLRHLRTAH